MVASGFLNSCAMSAPSSAAARRRPSRSSAMSVSVRASAPISSLRAYSVGSASGAAG